MSDSPETIYAWVVAGIKHVNAGYWAPRKEVEHAVEYRRADLVAAEIDRLRTEVETLRQRREGEYARMLEWRGIDQGDECKECGGAGVTAYGSTATWRGGIGGQVITAGICDKCWGSGNSNRPWLSLRKLESERQRARMPDELVEQLEIEVAFLSARNEGPDQRPLQVIRDILAWHEQGGSNNE